MSKVRDRLEWGLLIIWTPIYFALVWLDRRVYRPLVRAIVGG